MKKKIIKLENFKNEALVKQQMFTLQAGMYCYRMRMRNMSSGSPYFAEYCEIGYHYEADGSGGTGPYG